MSSLFDSLSVATSGLTAAQAGIDVAGQNLANVTTPGYSRRTLQLSELPPIVALSAGRGVSVDAIRAERDQFVLARLHTEQQGAGYDAAVAAALEGIEAAVGEPGTSLDATLTAFFDALAALASDPTSGAARDHAVAQADALARGFRQLAGRFEEARRTADLQLTEAVAEVNARAAEIARLNDRISAGGPDVDTLVDRRDEEIRALSALTNLQVLRRPDGAVDLAIGKGRPLVIGATAFQVATVPSSVPGLSAIESEGIDLTAEITGGRLGGLLHVRDTAVPGLAARLDRLAFELATALNTLHQTGVDAYGAAGQAFFQVPATASGAALAIAVDPALAADSGLLAASATGAAGDNQIVRAMAALRSDRHIDGNRFTPAEAWARLVAEVGSDLAGVRASAETRDQIVRQLERLRGQTSGVSIDEEAANLMRFERAYQASARYFATIDGLLDELMGMVR